MWKHIGESQRRSTELTQETVSSEAARGLGTIRIFIRNGDLFTWLQNIEKWIRCLVFGLWILIWLILWSRSKIHMSGRASSYKQKQGDEVHFWWSTLVHPSLQVRWAPWPAAHSLLAPRRPHYRTFQNPPSRLLGRTQLTLIPSYSAQGLSWFW